MPHSELHLFDLALCEYVGSVVNAHLTDTSPDAPAWAAWFQGIIGECPLLAFVRSPHEPKLLLHRTELQELTMALDCPPLEFYRDGLPWPALHQLYNAYLPEIRLGLSGTTAEAFAHECTQFAELLDYEPLELGKGIALVGEWVGVIRRLEGFLKLTWALPQPEGEYPTPTHSAIQEPTTAPTSRADHSVATVYSAGATGTEATATAVPPANPDDILSPGVAAKLLGVSLKHVIRLIQEGKLKAKNVGRGKQKPRYRLTRRDLQEFLTDGNTVVDVQPPASAGLHCRRGLSIIFPVEDTSPESCR